MQLNERQLPLLDGPTLDAIFDCVYGDGIEQIENDNLRDLVTLLITMAGYNYSHRYQFTCELYPVFASVMEMETNSEGTTMWLALGLAIKELYGMRNSTLRELLRLVSVRK